ncbi:MAG: hypothetical protein AAGD13_17500 [Pseudomonadota bacterium]
MRIIAPALILFSIIVGGIGMHTNVESKPRPEAEATIAQVLAAGGQVPVALDSIDQRSLVAARIEALEVTPDLVVIGDRSWQFLRQDLRWERSLFGAYIDTLRVSDIWTIARQLSAADRMPKTLVLGVSPDFIVTKPGDPSLLDRLANLVSPASEPAVAEISTSEPDAETARATAKPAVSVRHAEFDTLFPDGSVMWSQRRTTAESDTDLDQKVHALKNRLSADAGRAQFRPIGALNSVIGHLKLAGVNVHIVLTPLHPEIDAGIADAPARQTIDLGTKLLLQTARTFDVSAIGSFSPTDAGCPADAFADLETPASECLTRLIDDVLGADRMQPAEIVLSLH